MKLVDYDILKKVVIGCEIPKPISGTLSGHAAGEPFDKHVYSEIKKQFPSETFRQYEYLNDLYAKNPITLIPKKKERENFISKNPELLVVSTKKELLDKRSLLIQHKIVNTLLNRGEKETKQWSETKLFEEKQDDTADILIVKDGFYEIIDIKTRNITNNKESQPPNIISSFKIAEMCQLMIDNQEFENFTISYFELDWKLENDKLVCKNAHFGNLFKAKPNELYINWAAAMQIQIHICDLDQTFSGTKEEWAKSYLKHFVAQAKKRANDMITKFVIPFEKYIT